MMSTALANRVLNSALAGAAWPTTPPTGFVQLSLHVADPGLTGLNEVGNAGGSSYARKVPGSPIYGAASGGQSALLTPQQWTNMPSCTVTHTGIWSNDATPVFLFSGILGGPPRPFDVEDTISNLFSCPAHGLTANTPIRILGPTGGALPAALVAGHLYYVSATNLSVDHFSVSATLGGAVLPLPQTGQGQFYVDGSKTLLLGDTFTLSTDVISIV